MASGDASGKLAGTSENEKNSNDPQKKSGDAAGKKYEQQSGWQNDDDGSGGGGGGGGGTGWGGGYGGSSGPTETQRQAVENLAPIVAYQQDTLLGKADNAKDAFDISDQASANSRQFQSENAEKLAGAEWFSRLLNEQSVYTNQRDLMGNARYGSGLLDLNTMGNRVHDRNAVQVLEALEANYGNIDTAYYDALQNSVNNYNELALDTEAALRQGAADYAAQVNNISPELAVGTGDDGIAAVTVNGEERPLIDTEGRTLNFPDWIVTSYYNEHKKGPVEYRHRGHIRPDQAWANAISLQSPNSAAHDTGYMQEMLSKNTYTNSRNYDRASEYRK